MIGPDGLWYDDEPAGPLVRPFLVAGGRTRPSRQDLEMITLVVANSDGPVAVGSPEHSEIIRHCQQPISVAEVAALMNLPLVVIKVILSDLIEQGYLIFRSPPTVADVPNLDLLEAVLDGIRKL